MDELMKQLLQGEIFWYETNPVPQPHARPSAFVPYSNTPRFESGTSSCSNNNINGNMNKRMIGFLRKSLPTASTTYNTDHQIEESERDRCFRHMMNERMRRQRQKQCLLALHSMLPFPTKNDKQSVVQAATKRVQELEWLKSDMEKRNYELRSNFSGAMNKDQKNERTKNIRVKMEYPTSGIDSMLEVLKCLKKLDSKPTRIHSEFTNQQFLAVMDIETEMGAAEVEEAVNKTLVEAEWNTLKQMFNQGVYQIF